MDEQNRNGFQNRQNELNQKRVFIDRNAGPATQPTVTEGGADLPEPTFDQKIVLDPAFAEQKAQREQSPNVHPKPVSARRDLSDTPLKMSKFSEAPNRPAVRKRRMRTVRFKDTRLYSGELSSDALLRILRELVWLLLFSVIFAAVFWLRSLIVDQLTDVDYSALARSTQYSDPVTADVQWTEPALPEGVAAAQAVCTALHAPIVDRSIYEENSKGLLTPDVVAAGMETSLTADRVHLKTNMSNLDLLVQIYMSLSSGKPAITVLSDQNNGSLHYAVVTYMDTENDCIIVQTSDGAPHTLTFEQFITASRLENTKELPFRVRTGLTFGSWSRNTAIFVE